MEQARSKDSTRMSSAYSCEFCDAEFADWPTADKHECANDPDYLRGRTFERNQWGQHSEKILSAIARERDRYSRFDYIRECYDAVDRVYDRVEELLDEMFKQERKCDP